MDNICIFWWTQKSRGIPDGCVKILFVQTVQMLEKEREGSFCFKAEPLMISNGGLYSYSQI